MKELEAFFNGYLISGLVLWLLLTALHAFRDEPEEMTGSSGQNEPVSQEEKAPGPKHSWDQVREEKQKVHAKLDEADELLSTGG